MTTSEMLLDTLAQLPPSSTVLDIGCGLGRFALAAGRAGMHVIAVDSDPVCIESLARLAATEKVDIVPLVTDIAEDHLPRCSASLVIVVAILHFLTSKRQARATLERLKATTAPGGTLVLSTYSSRNDEGLRPLLLDSKWLLDSFSDWTVRDFSEGPGDYAHLSTSKRSRPADVVRFRAIKPSPPS